jgi:LysM repeat protein
MVRPLAIDLSVCGPNGGKRGWLVGIGVLWMTLVMTGCTPLEPMTEPEFSDLQLTVDTLKTTLRDAQRTIVELRAELESRRQELADVQIARAQFEGRVREAERRLVEARQVIELQREELAGSRSERERVARSGALLQQQMKHLQKQLSRLASPGSETRPGIAPTTLSSAPRRADAQEALARERPESRAGMASVAVQVSNAASDKEGQAREPRPRQVSVKPGDTLWSIGQRYHVSVKRLMTINQLADNQIEVGQALWLSPPATPDREKAE